MPDSKRILQHWHPLARLGLFALVYTSSVVLGMRLIAPPEHTSAMWPGSGVLLAALLLSRWRDWPALVLAATVLEPFAFASGEVPHGPAFLMATADSVEALCGAFLLRRYTGFHPSLERVRDVLWLVGLSGVLSTALGAALGVTWMALRGQVPWTGWAAAWRVFWVGDAMGVLLVAPVLLTFAVRGLGGWSGRRRLELGALLGTLLLSVHTLFHWAPASASIYHPASYLAFPFILWAALRFEARGTAAALLALAAVALPHTLRGYGPFATGPLAIIGVPERIVFLQSLLASVSVPGLLLAAALGERRRAQDKATRLNQELRCSLEELAATQQALVRRERLAALGELSASVAHEVRNPLAVIANSVAALTRRANPEDDATTWELLGVMGEEVARLDHLIDGLLDFARPREARLVPQPLLAVVEEALEAALRSEPRGERLRVTRSVEPDLPEVPLDAQLLHLAFSNLFTNALQAMPQGGSLHVGLSRVEREGHPFARVTLTDSGPGIPPEVIAHIFEPFYTTKASGTGLGLAIVRRIVDAHHGEIVAHSVPGQGTTFVVLLPLEAAASSTAAA